MKKSNLIILISLGILFLLTISFQLSVHNHIKKGEIEGVGLFVSQNRDLASFSKLEVTGKFKVLFRQDTITSLKIDAPKSTMDSIKTEVKNNQLRIYKSIKTHAKDTITVFISNPELEDLTIQSKAYLSSMNLISGDTISLSIKGKSKLNIHLDYNHINCTKDQTSILNLKGDTQKINFSTME
ncbi:GIN domain-containing protein [Croceitalea rosinachiae]|uniref:DUF2807 domain-containing protein n=1 Tax=Croceitalea rosinachiae TaxID=3075596 RepID=A0ABU3A6Q7_9FLAO|nr:DUF2807 domain-containing protein [Croceitalea sp. F388]MDT0605510.1 DUF2807 domain-containing protein [Croceitalea sp. F388]